tara:strand:+ start:387 stop:650 length:264 start_codon:yes stop_codon:yes gene_type:complete
MVGVYPLDLFNIFVNYFAGSLNIFFGIALIFFAYLGAKFRMPNGVFIPLIALFVVMMAGLGYQALYVVTIFLIAFTVYWILSKEVKY